MSDVFRFDVTVSVNGTNDTLRVHSHTGDSFPTGTLAFVVTNGDRVASCTMGLKQVELLRDMLNAHMVAHEGEGAR